jgi:hypothetical protein
VRFAPVFVGFLRVCLGASEDRCSIQLSYGRDVENQRFTTLTLFTLAIACFLRECMGNERREHEKQGTQ